MPQGIRKLLLFSKSKNVPENTQPFLHEKLFRKLTKKNKGDYDDISCRPSQWNESLLRKKNVLYHLEWLVAEKCKLTLYEWHSCKVVLQNKRIICSLIRCPNSNPSMNRSLPITAAATKRLLGKKYNLKNTWKLCFFQQFNLKHYLCTW